MTGYSVSPTLVSTSPFAFLRCHVDVRRLADNRRRAVGSDGRGEGCGDTGGCHCLRGCICVWLLREEQVAATAAASSGRWLEWPGKEGPRSSPCPDDTSNTVVASMGWSFASERAGNTLRRHRNGRPGTASMGWSFASERACNALRRHRNGRPGTATSVVAGSGGLCVEGGRASGQQAPGEDRGRRRGGKEEG